MRLRTRLILALLLLSAVPLAVIVFYNYTSAQRAVRDAIAREADLKTRAMETRLGSVLGRVRTDLERIGQPLMRRYYDVEGEAPVMLGAAQQADAHRAAFERRRTEQEVALAERRATRLVDSERRRAEQQLATERRAEQRVAQDRAAQDRAAGRKGAGEPNPIEDVAPIAFPNVEALSDLGELESLVESIEVELPENLDGHNRASKDRRWRVLTPNAIRMMSKQGARVGIDALESVLPEGVVLNSETGASLGDDFAELIDEAVTAAMAAEESAGEREAREARLESLATRFAARFGADARVEFNLGDTPPEPPRPPGAPQLAEAAPMPLPEVRGWTPGPVAEVRSGDRELARLLPRLNAKAVLGRIVSPLDAESDEIPFVITPEGLETLEPENLARLAPLGLVERLSARREVHPESPTDAAVTRTLRVDDEWVVVYSESPAAPGFMVGIASPVGESLATVRRAAVRNLAGGLGLLSLAILGILPLARRMTGDLEQLTDGAEQIASGNLETTVDVRTQGEIGQLAGAFNRMAHDLRANQDRLVDQAIKERLLADELARKNDELEAARRFQLSMLPESVPAHRDLDIAVSMRTATEVGGDYYDFARHDGGGLTVAIGDATGHGAVAGRMVTVVKSLFTAEGDQPPSAFLESANRTVRRMQLGRMAMALTLARFENSSLTVSSAGMPPAYVLRSDGRVEEVLIPGMPLGGIESRYGLRTVDLEPGACVVFMSDGLPEQVDANGDPLGYSAIREHLEQRVFEDAEALVSSLLELLELWMEGEAPADDVTFVAVRRRP